jgi:hypothetical protein
MPRRVGFERDRVAGFSIIFAAFCAALVISWKASKSVQPNVAQVPAPPTTDGLPGYPSKVDPVAVLRRARSLTERDQLRRILATSVASDGTVDLHQPAASIRYEFDSAPGEGPEAPRPPGTVRPNHFCGRQTVQVRATGIVAEPDQPMAPCRPSAGEPLPEPRCTPKQLWALALERGAPPDARAVIEYYRAHGGPAWRFSLAAPAVRFAMYGDCERELEGSAARPL